MIVETTTARIITVDYGLSLEAMIAAGKYDWKNDAITADRFPIEGAGIKKFRTKPFELDRDISLEDAVAAIKNENFTPANHAHGLAFGATFPEDQRTYSIASLDSSAWVRGLRLVVCLYGNDAERGLGLRGWYGVGGLRWRFLAVQEVSGV
jgi:hypothetical protein